MGGLAAAHSCGLATWGYAPKGYLTQNGPEPRLASLGVIEHKSSKYSPRTYANVKDSDGTIRLAYNFNSPGERCTFKAIGYYEKPYFDINLSEELPFVFEVNDWIEQNGIVVLNVAGNAGATKSEGTQIFNIVREYLMKVFRAYKAMPIL